MNVRILLWTFFFFCWKNHSFTLENYDVVKSMRKYRNRYKSFNCLSILFYYCLVAAISSMTWLFLFAFFMIMVCRLYIFFFFYRKREPNSFACGWFFIFSLFFFSSDTVKHATMRHNWYLNSMNPVDGTGAASISQVRLMCHMQLGSYQLPLST